jgi:hypothetical protein
MHEIAKWRSFVINSTRRMDDSLKEARKAVELVTLWHLSSEPVDAMRQRQRLFPSQDIHCPELVDVDISDSRLLSSWQDAH